MKKLLVLVGILFAHLGCGAAQHPSNVTYPSPDAFKVWLRVTEASLNDGSAVEVDRLLSIYFEAIVEPSTGIYYACALRRDDGEDILVSMNGPLLRDVIENGQCQFGFYANSDLLNFAKGHSVHASVLFGTSAMATSTQAGHQNDSYVNWSYVNSSWTVGTYFVEYD